MDKELFGLNTCCLKASDVRRTEASVCVCSGAVYQQRVCDVTLCRVQNLSSLCFCEKCVHGAARTKSSDWLLT